MEPDETFQVREACSVHNMAQPVRVINEEPQGDLKEGHEPTVNSTLLWDMPSQVFKHVGDARCVVVLAQTPSSRSALYPFDLI